MVVLGVINQEMAFAAIDWNTIGLLIGMMVIVLITKKTGLFQYVAIRAAKVAKGDPIRIMIYLALLTGFFSALLDNVTTILLIAPVTFVIADNLKINPLPIIIAEIIFSNVGGTATLIGGPPNILIGSAAGLTFVDFLLNLAPIALIISLPSLLIIWLFFRNQLKTTEELKNSIMRFDASTSITDVALLRKSLFVLAVTMIGFLVHASLGLEPATVALFGAGLLLVITNTHPEEVLKEVEWTTIIFFSGLFILVAGIEHVGLIDMMAEKVLHFTAGSMTATTLTILWASAVFSAFIDNIPFVATMIPLVQDLGRSGLDINPLWWALALGGQIGGNATLIGSANNLVAAGLTEKAGYKLGFKEYMIVGSSVTFVCMLISTVYVWLRYL